MRKQWIVVATALALVPACGAEQPREEAAPDLLFLRARNGVAVIEAGATAAKFRSRSAVPAADWSTAVQANVGRRTTDLVAVDTASGEPVWTGEAPGRLNVKVVSGDGDMVVLSPWTQAPYNYGRRVTRFVIARKGAAEPQSVELPGNYEPEAFSTDGTNLFVLRYTPARRPTQYQVRRLDLATETVHGVFSVDAELQESMRGTARVQTISPDGRFLYTLYSAGVEAERHAFVHVLNLDEKWAHCIDLPHGFAEARQRETTLAIAPDGGALYAANSGAGIVAEIDTEELSVTRVAPVEFESARSGAALSTASESTLHLGTGHSLATIDRASLEQIQSWQTANVSTQLKGLQVGAGGKKLYAALGDMVVVYDPLTGEEIENFDPPGVGGIAQLGPATRPQDYAPKTVTCAC